MLLSVEGITKEYLRAGRLFKALDDVSLSAGKGEFIGISGPSGSGKSTLFHVIAGLVRPTSGQVRLLGRELGTQSPDQLAALRRSGVGYVLQGQNLLQNFTLLENLSIAALLGAEIKNARSRALQLLDMLGLGGMEDEYPSSLSGGEQRRVAIARGFIHSPELVLADEPTSDLDRENGRLIMEFFRKTADEGTTILMTTHDQSFLSFTSKQYRMDQGRLTH